MHLVQNDSSSRPKPERRLSRLKQLDVSSRTPVVLVAANVMMFSSHLHLSPKLTSDKCSSSQLVQESRIPVSSRAIIRNVVKNVSTEPFPNKIDIIKAVGNIHYKLSRSPIILKEQLLMRHLAIGGRIRGLHLPCRIRSLHLPGRSDEMWSWLLYLASAPGPLGHIPRIIFCTNVHHKLVESFRLRRGRLPSSTQRLLIGWVA